MVDVTRHAYRIPLKTFGLSKWEDIDLRKELAERVKLRLVDIASSASKDLVVKPGDFQVIYSATDPSNSEAMEKAFWLLECLEGLQENNGLYTIDPQKKTDMSALENIKNEGVFIGAVPTGSTYQAAIAQEASKAFFSMVEEVARGQVSGSYGKRNLFDVNNFDGFAKQVNSLLGKHALPIDGKGDIVTRRLVTETTEIIR